jgi:hypothetical protein
MNPGKTLAIPTLVLAILLSACHSNQITASTPASIGPAETPQPTATLVVMPSAPMPPGTLPDNPAPVGYAIHADNLEFVVTGMVRPADGLVASGNMFNTQPGEHQHYVFISLKITCEQSLDQTCNLSIFKFTLLGSDGILNYPERLTTGVDNVLESTDLLSGTVISGYIPFIISVGNSRLLLIFESLPGESFYMALP